MEKQTIDDLERLLYKLEIDDPNALDERKGTVKKGSKWDYADEDVPEENWPED